MKMKAFVVAITLLLLLSGLMAAVGGEAVEGKESVEERIEENNENEEVTEIHDWHDLDAVRDDLNSTYSLMKDLDKNTSGYDELVDTQNGWKPIGDDMTNFTGTFDGNGYEISHLYINRSETNFVGVFGYANNGAEVTDIGLVDADVNGESLVGGLVGYNNGTINHSYASGKVRGEYQVVGGLTGYNTALVNNSYAN